MNPVSRLEFSQRLPEKFYGLFPGPGIAVFSRGLGNVNVSGDRGAGKPEERRGDPTMAVIFRMDSSQFGQTNRSRNVPRMAGIVPDQYGSSTEKVSRSRKADPGR
jgi:hypothetical protein